MKAKIAELKHYADNPRKGNINVIKESLSEHGQYRPVVVREETGEILAGNHTVRAARELGWDEIDVHYVSNLTDEQAAKIVLVDNRSNDLAAYDTKALLALIQSVDTLDGTGYDEDFVNELLSKLADKQTDKEAEPKEYLTKEGQLWQLGQHRLYVGDSVDPESYKILLGDEKADLLLTDPPYNVAYTGFTEDALTIQNDEMSDAEYREFLTKFFKCSYDALKPGGAAYSFYADREAANNILAFKDAGFHYAQTLVWVKNTASFGRQDYQNRHEPTLYGWKPGAAHTWLSDRKQTTAVEFALEEKGIEKLSKAELVEIVQRLTENDVVEFDKPTRNAIHPTMKPIALIEYFIENSSRFGEIVLDPFGGSGSTLIAAEKTNRKARIIELDPQYADAILERFQEFTGTEPVLLSEGGEEG